ncbi:AbrB/MazE/SpoVT family DNA-binding domain-containing protein [Undibacterium sp. FT79W]|jgi:uncharacterized membrane protein (UPF0127 family)|uniref:AbrB/MazE/SpoVT family DNA-binding domain-containing protein n=1 Tax=Undibacterium sp. FT79W TaxID=2762296 RepID=UPI00164CDA4E|nr:AbrB/MazE/SpoVT family DNA-binding domain-containing protein [Undibacterium sp. FT79W]MBC3879675.1 AbrB/MazE/SpoVT family DNA-binding domain-containing protein [Undibacterium sp. FT79W]
MTSTNTVPTRWTASLIDTGDGSGDMMIELPDDLLAQLDLHIGDSVQVEVSEDKLKLLMRKVNTLNT